MKTEWIARFEAEYEDLSVKLSKLGDFIEGGAWINLPPEDRDLLVEQRTAMTAYLGVLDRRRARIPANQI